MTGRRPESNRRTFLKTAGAAGALVTVAGCASSGGGSETTEGSENGEDGGGGGGGGGEEATETTDEGMSRQGGTLNFAQTSSPVALDPINNKGGNYSIAIKHWVYSPVLTYDQETNLVPMLAEEIPELEEGGTAFTLNVDQDATFHNGDPVTAEDVKYTFTQPVAESTPWASDFQVIENIEVQDEKTARFTLARPYKPILNAIAFPVAPKSVREEDREAFGTNTIVGSGPWQVTEFEEGDHVTLEAWDEYWGEGRPNLDELVLTPINEPTTRITNLRTGDMDVVRRIPPKQWEVVEGMGDAGIVEGPGLSYQFAAFNQNEGECAKRDVRLAIDHCIDVDSAVEKFIAPTGSRMYSPLPEPVMNAWDMPVDEWKGMWSEKDIDRAKELFERAGVPDDWTCKIRVSSTEKRRQMAVSIANGIKETGYDAEVQYLDFARMLEIYNSGDADELNIYLLGWTRSPEPDRFLYELLYIDGAFQGQYYENERFNELLRMAHEEIDRETRREQYIEAIELFIEDRVHIPLYNTKVTMGAKEYVNDLQAHPISTQNPDAFGARTLTNSDVGGPNVWLDQ
jgi:peptide/nickel transport system substrate-binding protein